MNIESIIYETTRDIYSIEDKLRIATIFIFCYERGGETFAELLYTDDHEAYIERIKDEYATYDIDLSVRLSDRNVRDCFNRTLRRVKEKYDADGYFRAIHDKDPFAMVIQDILLANQKMMSNG